MRGVNYPFAWSAAAGLAIVATLVMSPPAAAQQMTSDGCMRLLGSVACPGFSNAWINPANVSQAFPFFTDVSSVGAFDAAFFNYISSQDGYRRTKFGEQLACTGDVSQTTIRYQRTVLCSQLVNEHWSQICTQHYNASSVATGPRMVCQNSCELFAYNENDIVQNQTYCPLVGGTAADYRQGNLTKGEFPAPTRVATASSPAPCRTSTDSHHAAACRLCSMH